MLAVLGRSWGIGPLLGPCQHSCRSWAALKASVGAVGRVWGSKSAVLSRLDSESEAVRRLMNTLKVDGLTRALTRQLCFPLFSLIFLGFS